MTEDLLERVIRAQIRAVGEIPPAALDIAMPTRPRAGDVFRVWTEYVTWAGKDSTEYPACSILCDTLKAQAGALLGAILRSGAPEAPVPAPDDVPAEADPSPVPESEAAEAPLDALEP